jgi:GH24 family phage-related lysozyme (muramidase)
MRSTVRDAFFDFNEPLEGVVSWMYLDIKGFVTVGVGNLLPNPESAAVLPFFPDGSPDAPASDAEKRQGWHDVNARQDLARVGHRAFPSVCNLRLSNGDIRALVDTKLLSNERTLLGTFPQFPNWPADAQLGLMSMAWALGAGFPATWPRFTAACRALDFASAAAECRMQEAGNPGVIPRNNANEALFRNAAKVQKPENGYDPDTLYYPTQLLDVIVVEGGSNQ